MTMNIIEATDLVAKVQDDINMMLVDLSKATGREIKRAEICKIDVTCMQDIKPTYIKSFKIDLEPNDDDKIAFGLE